MRRRRTPDTSATTVVSDVFAGMMIATLLILLMVWLQALAESIKTRRLKEIQEIFENSFDAVVRGESHGLIVDKSREEIIIQEDLLFETGEWKFSDNAAKKEAFSQVRGDIATVLEQIQLGFEKSDFGQGLEASEHVEVRVVGHTDCVPTSSSRRKEYEDNLDLSSRRAAALMRVLTAPCDTGDYRCCADGSMTCDEPQLRIDPFRWQILPVGRSYYEPLGLTDAQQDEIRAGQCSGLTADTLGRQRRVVIQIVPRLDKLYFRKE